MTAEVMTMSFLYVNGKLYFKGGNKTILFEDLPVTILEQIRKLSEMDPAFLSMTESNGITDPTEKLKLFVSFDRVGLSIKPLTQN
jgi:hypothetical protein